MAMKVKAERRVTGTCSNFSRRAAEYSEEPQSVIYFDVELTRVLRVYYSSVHSADSAALRENINSMALCEGCYLFQLAR